MLKTPPFFGRSPLAPSARTFRPHQCESVPLFRPSPLAITALLALAACETTAPPSGPILQASSATSPTTQMPLMGTTPVDLNWVRSMFHLMCYKVFPDPAAHEEELASAHFTRDPATGTYFHSSLQMSFRFDDNCSMVFNARNNTDAIEYLYALATVTAQGRPSRSDYDRDTEIVTVDGPDGSHLVAQEISGPPGSHYIQAVLSPGA